MRESNSQIRRRRLIKSTGVAGLVGLAGCTGGSDGGSGEGSDGDSGTPTDTPKSQETTEPATTGSAGSKEPLRWGMAAPDTGEFGFLGTAERPAVEMIVEKINQSGGINGREVKFFFEDTKADPETAITATKKLLDVNNVDVYTGHTSFTVLQVIERIKEANVPFIMTCGGTTDFNSIGGERIFRTWPNDNLGGIAAALEARYKKYNGLQDHERLAMVSCKTSNCRSLIEPTRKVFEGNGGTVTSVVETTRGKGSYDTEVQKIMASEPDIVMFLTGPEDSAKIMRSAFNRGYEGSFAGQTELSNPDFRESTPNELTEELIVYKGTSPKFVTEERRQNLIQRYKDFSGHEPGICWLGAVDGANTMALAMKAAGVQGEVTKDTIAEQIRPVALPEGEAVTGYSDGAKKLESETEINYQGMISACDFDERGEIVAPYDVYQIKSGELEKTGFINLDAVSKNTEYLKQ